MFFTQEDYLKIENWLKARAIKDSQFKEITTYDYPKYSDYVILYDSQDKENKKIRVDLFLKNAYEAIGKRPIINGIGDYSITTTSKYTTNPNEAIGEGSIAIGLYGNKANEFSSVGIGYKNVLNSQFAWGLGNDNTINTNSDYSKVFGNNNSVSGKKNYVVGNNNNINGHFNIVLGQNNSLYSTTSVVLGQDISTNQNSIFIGKGLSDNGAPYIQGKTRIILGQYNDTSASALFAIGDGEIGNQSNLFSIEPDGDIWVKNLRSGLTSLQDYIKNIENSKQDKLIAGTGINISSDNTITCTLDPTIFVVVDSLPTTPLDANINKIHLIKDTTVSGNLYSEYLWIGNAWEKLGDFQPSIDLSNYVDKTSNQTIEGTKTFDKLVKVKNLTIISQQDNTEGSNISLELQDDREIDPFLANVLSLGDSRYGTPCRVVIPLWNDGLKSLVPIYPSEVITNSYLYYNYAKLDKENVFTNNIVIKSSNNNGDALIIVDDNKHILSLLNKDVLKLDVSQRLLFQNWNESTLYSISIDNNKINFEHDGLPVSLSGIATPTANNDAANKEYVDTQVKTVNDKVVTLETKTDSLDSRTPVDSGISFLNPSEFFPEYSEDTQDVQNYILPGFLQINNQMTSVDGLFNHIRDNNLAGKAAYFTIYGSLGNPSTTIIGNIDTGAVGYKISFSTISRYSDNTSFNNRLIFFEIEIGNLTGDGITIMNSRLMNICIKDTLSQIDNNTSKIQTLETKNTELTNTITTLESRIAELENIISQITIKEE